MPSSSDMPDGPGVEGAALVVLGLGANLGDRLAALRSAAAHIARLRGVVLQARSSVYETPPAGGPPQPDYLNSAVAVSTALPLGELLAALLHIERSLGRRRPDLVRWGPRSIDIDVLWTDRGAHREPSLTVPHPRLTERPFALQPLLELVPEAAGPEGHLYAELPAAHHPMVRVGAL